MALNTRNPFSIAAIATATTDAAIGPAEARLQHYYNLLRFAILKLCHSLLFMLVSVQYHPHCHVAIFSQGLHALRVRSQASGRKQ